MSIEPPSEREAENWVRWARTPGHDAYWYYRDAFFAEVVPAPGGRTLEIGCGEGRVTRDLAGRGHRVVSIDLSPALVRHAHQADPQGAYVLADGTRLPFHDACFDLAVSYNSLMEVSDMPRTVQEAARVLDRGGRFCVCVTHPLADAGRFESDEPDACFTIKGSYFGRSLFEGTFERDGLTVTLRGWTYALEDYARALEQAGLLIEAIREPRAADTSARRQRWRRLPLFLHLRAVKP